MEFPRDFLYAVDLDRFLMITIFGKSIGLMTIRTSANLAIECRC